MSTEFILYSKIADNSALGCKVIEKISKTMSPKEFDNLCEENPKFSINTGAKWGWTALFMAIYCENITLMTHIYNKGGRFDFVLYSHLSALHIATTRGYYMTVKKILDLGIPVNIITKIDRTALWHSLNVISKMDPNEKNLSNHYKVAKLLYLYGGSIEKYTNKKEIYWKKITTSSFEKIQQIFQQIQNEVHNEKEKVFNEVNACTGLPMVLNKLIRDYILPSYYEHI